MTEKIQEKWFFLVKVATLRWEVHDSGDVIRDNKLDHKVKRYNLMLSLWVAGRLSPTNVPLLV